MCGLALPRGTLNGSIYTHSGFEEREQEGGKQNVKESNVYLYVCMSVISEHLCYNMITHPLEHVSARWLIGTHAEHGGNSGRLTRKLFYWPICWNISLCNHFKDVFLWGRSSSCFKQRSVLWLRVCNLLSAGWQAGNLSGRVRERIADTGSLKASLRLTTISSSPPSPKSCSSVVVISAVYPGLWRLSDNGQVICPWSFLNHRRATFIVLSVWTGKISVGCLV